MPIIARDSQPLLNSVLQEIVNERGLLLIMSDRYISKVESIILLLVAPLEPEVWHEIAVAPFLFQG